MLTKTTVSAIRTLVYLGLAGADGPLSPRQIAEEIGESPTYMAKIVRQLVKAGILRAHRGVAGGITFQRPPNEVSLLAITEACQGMILASFCEEAPDLDQTCAFHEAAAELHGAVVNVLSRWTLEHFLQKPRPVALEGKRIPCWLEPAAGRHPEAANRARKPAAVRSRQSRGMKRQRTS